MYFNFNMAFKSIIILLLIIFASVFGYDEFYSHSNDTFKITLEENQQLYGPPGKSKPLRISMHNNIFGLNQFSFMYI